MARRKCSTYFSDDGVISSSDLVVHSVIIIEGVWGFKGNLLFLCDIIYTQGTTQTTMINSQQ